MTDAPTENQQFLKVAKLGVNHVPNGAVVLFEGISISSESYEFDSEATMFLNMAGRKEIMIAIHNGLQITEITANATRKVFADPSELDDDDFDTPILPATGLSINESNEWYLNLSDPDLFDPAFPDIPDPLTRKHTTTMTAVVVQLRRTGAGLPSVLQGGFIKAI